VGCGQLTVSTCNRAVLCEATAELNQANAEPLSGVLPFLFASNLERSHDGLRGAVACHQRWRNRNAPDEGVAGYLCRPRLGKCSNLHPERNVVCASQMRERTLKQKLEYAVYEKMGKDISVLIRTSSRVAIDPRGFPDRQSRTGRRGVPARACAA
jgi:hypothetical protein